MRCWAWVGLALLCGCRTWQTAGPPVPPLPRGNTLVLDQLVVSSDFALSAQHRLLDELRMERGDVAKQLNLTASAEPIEVFLFGDEARYREFMKARFPQFPERRAFFVESDTRLVVYAHWGEHVAEDLRHEVAHGYLHSSVRHLPLWFDEGLAEYFEVPRGTNGLNWPHVDELTAALQKNQWQPDVARLEKLTSAADMTQLDYAEAWAWVHLCLESTSERREMLCQYVTDLRTNGNAAPFSLRLRSLGVAPQRTLIEHLQALAAGKR